jgi:LPXTG-site transpeptidase (sortase) family protein
MVVAITGNNPGAYQNTIPVGGLRADSTANVTNALPATDTLVITENPVEPAPPVEETQGGRNRGRNRASNPPLIIPVTGEFIIPVTGFAPGRVTQPEGSLQTRYDSTSLVLDIPVLKVKAPIVGVQSSRGKWDVSWLQDQIGWLNGTAYPTWKGNSVLTAHVANADGKPGVFANLKALGVGEYVFVYNAGYRYTYKVVSNELVEPTDSRVMKHEDRSFLTLITCDSYDEKTGTYLRRVAVGAVLVDVSRAE